MRRGGSALLRIADEAAVPAGHALAVDRVEFSRRIADAVAAEPRIRVIREEVTQLGQSSPSDELTILATGPLTSDALRDRKSTRLNSSHLGISYAVFCLKKKKKPYLTRYIIFPAAQTCQSTTRHRAR